MLMTTACARTLNPPRPLPHGDQLFCCCGVNADGGIKLRLCRIALHGYGYALHDLWRIITNHMTSDDLQVCKYSQNCSMLKNEKRCWLSSVQCIRLFRPSACVPQVSADTNKRRPQVRRHKQETTGSHEQPNSQTALLVKQQRRVSVFKAADEVHLICVHLDNDLHKCLLISPRQGVLHGLELADKDVDVSCEARLCLLLCQPAGCQGRLDEDC